MEFIETKFSRKNPGHYTPGVISNGMLFISGQLSIIPETGEVCPGGIEAEAKQALANMEAVLLAAGLEKEDVVMCRVYTPDVNYWPIINEVYKAFFGSHKPARVVVPSNTLHHNCLVEIEAIATTSRREA